MQRLILAMVATAAFVAFAMANGHHVTVSLVFGAPVKVRQIFLLMTALGTGVVGTLLVQQYYRVKRLRQSQRRELLRAPKRDSADSDELGDE